MHRNKPLPDLSIKFIINEPIRLYIGINESNESFDDEDVEVPHSSEKSSDYFTFLKHTIPAHYDHLFD